MSASISLLPAAAVVALVVLALGHRFSINFATEAHVDEAPLDHAGRFGRSS